MTIQLLYSKMQSLHSEKLKEELLSFMDYLLSKQFAENSKSAPKRVPQFGCAKGMFKMSPDFDAPLDDFKEYMP